MGAAFCVVRIALPCYRSVNSWGIEERRSIMLVIS